MLLVTGCYAFLGPQATIAFLFEFLLEIGQSKHDSDLGYVRIGNNLQLSPRITKTIEAITPMHIESSDL